MPSKKTNTETQSKKPAKSSKPVELSNKEIQQKNVAKVQKQIEDRSFRRYVLSVVS
jgi:hypothetical protein